MIDDDKLCIDNYTGDVSCTHVPYPTWSVTSTCDEPWIVEVSISLGWGCGLGNQLIASMLLSHQRDRTALTEVRARKI